MIDGMKANAFTSKGAAVLGLALGLLSCGEGPGNTALHVDHLAELAYVEEIRIGSVNDPDIGFSRIRHVRVSEKGEVYLLDSSAKEVRVFSAEGERLRVIGGPGEGPGEFSFPVDMGLLGDTLWVSDGRTQRLTWFGPDGDVLFTTPGHGVPFEAGVRGVRVTLTPSHPRPDGLIGSDLSLFVSPNREIRPYRYPVVLFDRKGAVVDTVRWDTADVVAAPTYRGGGGQRYAPYLRPLRPVEAELADGRIVLDWMVPAGSSEGLMDILKVGPAEDSVYHRTLRYDAIPVPGHILDSLMAPRLENAAAMGESERKLESALREAIQLPEFRPPVRVVHAGNDGTFWLQLNTPTTAVADWILIGDDGSALGRLSLPLGTQIHHSALPTVWAVALDTLDVPWLIRLRVDDPPRVTTSRGRSR